jgi:hypothetical protein
MKGTLTVRSEFERIYMRDGSLEPEVIVAEATPEGSPLHRYFIWDDSTAAHQWRLWKARNLIGKVKISVTTEPEHSVRVRAYVSVPRSDGRSYESLSDALGNDETRDMVLEQCAQELAAVRHKYAALCDVNKAWQIAITRRVRRRAA